MRIQHNLSAMNALSNYNGNNNALSSNLEKLSSGYRINSAADDAAGLAISEKMRSQIAGLEKAQDNANDGVSLVQTAEGALTEVNSMLTRLTELATQSANGTYEDGVDRANIQEETNALLDEMDRISQSTNFNGINLLDGSLATSIASVTGVTFKISGGALTTDDAINVETASDGTVTALGASKLINEGTALASSHVTSVTANTDNPTSGKGVYKFTVTLDKDAATASEYEKWNGVEITIDTSGQTDAITASDQAITSNGTLKLQVGDTADSYQQVGVEIQNMNAASLGLRNSTVGGESTLNLSTQDGAAAAIDTIKTAVNTVSKQRGKLGALQNRLDYTLNNLDATDENITAAESQIRDVDMAKEMTAYSKNNILVQAAQSMLAQANSMPQGVLQLLQ